MTTITAPPLRWRLLYQGGIVASIISGWFFQLSTAMQMCAERHIKARTGNRWVYCEMCEHNVVICGKCGNNTCNAGHGEVDELQCDACDEAHALYQRDFEVENRAYCAVMKRLSNARSKLFDLRKLCEEIATTGHIVGRAFCWVDTPLIVKLREALDIQPYVRKEDPKASYAAECRKRGIL